MALTLGLRIEAGGDDHHVGLGGHLLGFGGDQLRQIGNAQAEARRYGARRKLGYHTGGLSGCKFDGGRLRNLALGALLVENLFAVHQHLESVSAPTRGGSQNQILAGLLCLVVSGVTNAVRRCGLGLPASLTPIGESLLG